MKIKTTKQFHEAVMKELEIGMQEDSAVNTSVNNWTHSGHTNEKRIVYGAYVNKHDVIGRKNIEGSSPEEVIDLIRHDYALFKSKNQTPKTESLSL